MKISMNRLPAQGTPKNLRQAIVNGLAPYAKNNEDLIDQLEAHVKDFLSQCFEIMINDNATVVDLWASIIRKE